MTVTFVGIDLAKSVFQLDGVDDTGRVVLRRRLSRDRFLEFFVELPPCRIGLEACAGVHHWARRLIALGHDVRPTRIAPTRAFVERNKTDAADAEAICEAVSRPNMRFVPLEVRGVWQGRRHG